jgi:hypothetical protein
LWRLAGLRLKRCGAMMVLESLGVFPRCSCLQLASCTGYLFAF